MAVGQGLSLVIANPADVRMQETRLAADLLAGRDPHSAAFLQRLADPNRAKDPKTETERPSDALRDQILRGDRDTIAATVQRRLEQGADPLALLDGELFPAMQEVGDRYQRREYFLPQLLASAEAMERAVQVLEPHFRRENQLRRGTVVLATVKGDVHDIGKNIVGLLLRNHGFDVIDLGKSVDAETIVSEAVARQAAVIGLSALMTTTMPEMKLVLEQARQRCPNVKVVLGGAVVTAKYAAGIGADGYAADAVQAVALVDGLLHKKDAG
jgi:5-methyltetrahydrofolate--homocysteine methyltransferase